MAPPISFDLSLYVRIGRYDLPEPTRTALPTGTPAWNLLAQEASAVTYNKDTDTLFVLGDGGTAIVQVDKTGKLIDTMTLAKGSSPQGTDFYDPEGLAYVGGGKFVFVEERDRQVVEFTYKKDATLARSDTKTVKLGTTIGNIGLEGIAFDTSATNSYVLVKESGPEGIFLTSIDFSATTAGTTSNGGVPVASNGSSTTANSTNLFDPAKAGLNDFADVYALSNVPALTGTSFASHLLILSQESGKVVDIGRDGTVYSSLTLQLDAGSTLSVADQTHEGLAMDAAGNIYIVSENGGGDVNHPQLWVYAVSTAANKAPTSVVFNNPVTSILENIPITTLYKLADVAVVDDGLGTNALSVSGADAASFQVDATGLYLKTGTVLDYETKKIYEVSVNVDDVSVGTTPDASKAFSLTLIDVVNENVPVPNLAITEASPWSSGNSLYKADWFEITNIGSTTVDLTGLRFDDDSNAFGSSVPLQGVSSLAPGKSAVFLEAVDTEAATISQLTSAFKADWFGANVPSGFQIGTYTGAGVGLSTGGDALNLFDQFGRLITGIKVGASTTYKTFTNDTAAGSSSFPTPTVSTLSTLGTNGAFASAVPATGTTSEIGSPGKVAPLYNFSAGTYGVTEGTVAGALSNGTVRVNRSGDTSAASSVVLELAGGTAKGAAAAPVEGTSTGPSTTTTPYVLPAAGSGVATKSLLTVGDSIGGYKMAGIPDGLGAFDNGDGTFTLLMNHEIGNTSGVTRAHGGKGAFVSSWLIRKSDLTVVSGADLIQNIYDWDATTQASKAVANNSANSNGFSLNRFCAADLAAQTAFYNAGSGLGSQAKIFLNGEEGGATGFALANIASGTSKGNSYVLGKFSLSTNGSGLTGVGGYENLLANWFAQDKTVVIGNNDGGTGLLNNAVVVYQGTKTNSGSEADKAGLNNGTLKFVSVAGISAEISDATTQATAITSGTRFSLSTSASTTFARPEDGAWDPTDPTKYYFVTTDRIDNASDGNGTQIGMTRLWRLTFDDIKNPDLGGKIDLLVDGDIVNGKRVNMFDNISIDNYGHILLLEDVGNAAHNGKIYQYDIATDTVKLLAQHDAARFGDVGVAATSPFSQDEETSGIIDMEPILGAGWSLFVDQAHYTTGISTDLVEGGQLLAMFNPDIYKSSQPDYINTAQMVAFAAGESSKDVLVPIYGDTRLEGPETFNLSLSNPSSGSVVGATQPTATVTIADRALISGTATASVKEGTGVNASGLLVATGNLSVSDFDAGEAKFNTAVVPASGNFGSLTITEAGAYTYSLSNTLADVQNLAAGQTKIDTFTVKSFDGTASKDIVVTINGASAAFNAVAAGDPTTNRVTLWTRTYDTSDTSKRTGITEAVTVQVATDAAFNTIVFTADGQTSAADHDYTVKIDATGLLADTTFYYRYKTKAGELSSVGTFKTAPLASSDGAVHIGHSGDVDGLMRPYSLMVDLAAQKFDAFIFNGDTMYETASTGSPATPSTKDAATGVVTQQALLDAYHRKYLENLLPTPTGTYPGLKDFFAAQANFTTWDNHELGNKAYINGGAPAILYNSSANGSAVVAYDVNTTGQYINDLVTFDTLQQAFLDYQPIRTPDVINAPGDPRSNGELKLYGTQQYGQNAQIFNLDTRTFRDVRLNKAVGGDDTGARADNPDRTVLGATQKAWLKQALLDASAAGVTWKFINITDPIDMIGGYDSGLDGGKSWWGGYRAERNELLKFIDDNNIRNVVFLASDDHQGRINELTYLPDPSLDPTKPANYKTLDRVFSIVDGPMGATGPDSVTDHSFTNVKALADALAANQLAAGINPIGLDKNFTGLFNVYREGDATATTSPKAVDFYTPDTNNYVSLDVTPEGVLTVSLRGINSYAQNSFPEPSAANAARTILSFSIDGNPILSGTAGVDSVDPGSSTIPTFTGEGQKLATGSGNDVLDLALISGHDNVVFAGSGSDTVYAGERDVITGGTDADTIWAINGDGNRLDGGKGDDIFYIGSKGNRALGGEGADRFYIQDGAGTNYFNGGAGADEFWLVSGPGEYPAAKQFVMDFKVGQDKVGLQGVSFTSLRFSQVGVDTLLKVAGVEVGQFSNVSVSTLNSQSNFIGLG